MIRFYSLIIVIIVGIISNMLALIVLSKSHIKKTSTGVYLIFLSFADTIVLSGEFLRWLHGTYNGSHILGIDLMNNSAACCMIFNYIRYFGRIWSCWLIVIITVERYLSIAYPLRVNSVSKPKKAMIICFIEMAVAAFVCLPAFFTLGIKRTGSPPMSRCAMTNKVLYEWLVLFTTIFAGEMFLPSIIVFSFTILILRHLFKASQLRRIISISQPHSSSTQLTSTLLGLALTFIFIRLPYIITYMVRRHSQYKGATWEELPMHVSLDISYVLSVANYAINFFLYCLCGSIFRSELKRVLCCQQRQRPSATYILDHQSSPSRNRLSRVHYNGLGVGNTTLAAV